VIFTALRSRNAAFFIDFIGIDLKEKAGKIL